MRGGGGRAEAMDTKLRKTLLAAKTISRAGESCSSHHKGFVACTHGEGNDKRVRNGASSFGKGAL